MLFLLLILWQWVVTDEQNIFLGMAKNSNYIIRGENPSECLRVKLLNLKLLYSTFFYTNNGSNDNV